MSVCRPSISDNFNSDIEGRVVCCEGAMGSETRHTLFFALQVVLSVLQRRRAFRNVMEACCMRWSSARTRICCDGGLRLLLRGGSMFSLWVFLQALSIAKCSGAVVRHFALDVDPFWALCPCETRVFDPHCWCVD